MPKRVRLTLANKCQLAFGAAVFFILLAALFVVWLRMEVLVERGPEHRARDLAEAWLADQIDVSVGMNPVDAMGVALPVDQSVRLKLYDRSLLESLAAADPFLGTAIGRFEARSDSDDRFAEAEDADGAVYYRYVRAIRESDLTRMQLEADAEASHLADPGAVVMPDLDTSALDDPLESVLVIELRDADAAGARMINGIYLVAAGLVAALLAIGLLWFILSRLVLAPLRLICGYAGRASEGDTAIRADMNSGDEFEQLAEMFNALLDRMKANETELLAANKTMQLKLGKVSESNESLYEANKIKGEFLANVSHELRTPLNAIVGFGEVLQETLVDRTGPVDEKRKRYITNIINASRRLLDLINDLLDLAKIEAGRMELAISPVSAKDTAEGLVNLIRPLAEKRGIKLVTKVPPNLPIAKTDAGKLQQILFNFLSNAVKFSPDSGTVTMAVVHLPSSQPDGVGHLRFSVSDTGPGISAEEQERVFDKFTQLDPTATKAHGGTGLGLTISRELADLLQGRIEIDSDAGAGATFSLVLPMEPEIKTAPLMPEVAEAKGEGI